MLGISGFPVIAVHIVQAAWYWMPSSQLSTAYHSVKKKLACANTDRVRTGMKLWYCEVKSALAIREQHNFSLNFFFSISLQSRA